MKLLEAKHFTQLWLDTVKKADLSQILSLYNEQAILQATFSREPYHGRDAISAYFENLLRKPSLDAKKDGETFCIDVGEGVYTICGNYTFIFEKDSKLQNFASRYSFVLDLKKESPILHHHSSLLP